MGALMSSPLDRPAQIERIAHAIVARSTEAVLAYREASGLPDNELPEEFIASNIAVPLHRDLGLLCRREWLYTCIARTMGVTITDEVRASIGQFRADLALLDASERLCVAVELKIDDGGPGRPPFAIVNDIAKLRKLARLCAVTPLALIMLTDLENRELEDRRADLEAKTPGVAWVWGPPQRARARVGDWGWAVGCAQVSTS